MNVQFGDEHLHSAHASALQGWVDQHQDSLTADEQLRSRRVLTHLERRLSSGGAPVRPFVPLSALILTVVGALFSLWYSMSISTAIDAALDSPQADDAPATAIVAGIFPTLVMPIMVVLLSIAVLAASTPTWARVICIVLGMLALLVLTLFVPVMGSMGAYNAAQPMLALAGSAIVFVLAWILGGRK